MGRRCKALIGLMTFIYFLFGATMAGATTDKQPQTVVNESHYDFGSVVEGNSIDHTFVIVNKGDAPLEILKIESG